MSESAPLTLSIRVWIARHKFRPGVFLDRSGRLKSFPMFFERREHAETALSYVSELVKADWVIAQVNAEEIAT